jgi:L-lactate utilization protein LutB
MIALTQEERIQQVMEAIQRAGGRAFLARKTDEGVRIESA